MQLRGLERWISLVRLIVFPFVVAAVAAASYPPGWELWAWVTTAVFGAGAVTLFVFARLEIAGRHQLAQSLAAQIFDTAITAAYILVFSFAKGTPVQQLLYIALAAACVRFRFAGGLAVAALSAPVLFGFAKLRAHQLGTAFSWRLVISQTALEALIALIVSWLVQRLAVEASAAEDRAVEAESLRDQLGRRADLLDATNRCARALSSSLNQQEAFAAFIRELRPLLPFDRVAIVLAEEGRAQVMATAGSGAEAVFPPGTHRPVDGTLLEHVLNSTRPIYRARLEPDRYPEEKVFLELGLKSRVAAPLLSGARAIGMLAVVRKEEDGFSLAEIELAGLLGRLVAGAAQNLRSYELERRTVDELRRLSSLRADFVSLVSHELRTPMAAMVGAARTLQERWRDLGAEQREAFLGLIASETERLAGLVAEVLDTSRIDAGSFSYEFAPVDLTGILEEAAAAATLAQEEVPVVVRVPNPLPVITGDPARLRQVITNLIDNAVKYSPSGKPVEVRATTVGAGVAVDVVDRGPGIASNDQQLVFEKFGRVRGPSAKPGSGLGLYIARAIAEAHGGRLEVASTPGLGATFTLSLPAA